MVLSIMCCHSLVSPNSTNVVEHGIPDTLLGSWLEPDIDRVPLAIPLMHVPPGAPDPQNMKHSVQETSIVVGWPRLPAVLRRQQAPDHCPLFVRQIAACQACLQEADLHQNSARSGLHYVNTAQIGRVQQRRTGKRGRRH